MLLIIIKKYDNLFNQALYWNSKKKKNNKIIFDFMNIFLCGLRKFLNYIFKLIHKIMWKNFCNGNLISQFLENKIQVNDKKMLKKMKLYLCVWKEQEILTIK